MKSVFANLELNTIRYSLVWEDWQTLYTNLNIQTHDNVAIITSAGCNVLNALLKQPNSITAIDLNPVQNNLLKLKLCIIRHHDYKTWRGIMGFAGKDEVMKAWSKIEGTLQDNDATYWADVIHNNPGGLITAGKLEKYICAFLPTLHKTVQEKLHTLFQFTCVHEQCEYYRKNLSNEPMFVENFSSYFSDENLGRGRDPRLFTYAEEKGDTSFLKRLGLFFSRHLAKDNFYARFFFFGAEGMPIDILPPCHRPEYFALLKEGIDTVQIIHSEAIDYLLSANAKHINKASLSNIFEYASHDDFKETIELLYGEEKRKLTIIYWNLLQNQLPCDRKEKRFGFFTAPVEKEACFYFNNAQVLKHI